VRINAEAYSVQLKSRKKRFAEGTRASPKNLTDEWSSDMEQLTPGQLRKVAIFGLVVFVLAILWIIAKHVL
jgi:hypothetical protein